MASFHRPEEGPDRGRPMPVGAPEPARSQHRPTPWDDYLPRLPFEIIEMSSLGTPATEDDPGRRAWIRTAARVPDDPALHACLLTYVSDFATAFVAVRTVASPLDSMVATLDHSIWFHRPGRIDDWVYVDMQAMNNGGHRGLVLGTATRARAGTWPRSPRRPSSDRDHRTRERQRRSIADRRPARARRLVLGRELDPVDGWC
jgi:acyl-CoA thioesterase II